MYTVSVQAHYDAAHFLRKYKGKCERLHGHRYVVEAALQTSELNEAGIAFDFVDLKRELRALAGGAGPHQPERPPRLPRGGDQRREPGPLVLRAPEGAAAGRARPRRSLYVRVWETPNQWALYGALPTGGPPPMRASSQA